MPLKRTKLLVFTAKNLEDGENILKSVDPFSQCFFFPNPESLLVPPATNAVQGRGRVAAPEAGREVRNKSGHCRLHEGRQQWEEG